MAVFIAPNSVSFMASLLSFLRAGGGFFHYTSPDCSCISHKTLVSVIESVPFICITSSPECLLCLRHCKLTLITLVPLQILLTET